MRKVPNFVGLFHIYFYRFPLRHTFQMSMKSMTKKLDTTVKTSVRSTVASARYLDKIKAAGGNSDGGESLCIIKSGNKCIVGGHGNLFETFLQNQNLSGQFSDSRFLDVFHPDYESSNLQILRYDQCFKNMPNDASKSKLLLWYNIQKYFSFQSKLNLAKHLIRNLFPCNL